MSFEEIIEAIETRIEKIQRFEMESVEKDAWPCSSYHTVEPSPDQKGEWIRVSDIRKAIENFKRNPEAEEDDPYRRVLLSTLVLHELKFHSGIYERIYFVIEGFLSTQCIRNSSKFRSKTGSSIEVVTIFKGADEPKIGYSIDGSESVVPVSLTEFVNLIDKSSLKS